MAIITPFDFLELTENENKLSKQLHLPKREENMPSDTSIDNILAYSKALSIRKSENLGFIENVLN